jgi:hypothetical protein
MAEHTIHLDLGLSLGAIEIGALVSTLLYGMALVQTYIYATSSPHDRVYLKLFVGLVLYVSYCIPERVLICNIVF